jgi:hypothetical protein
MFVLTVAQPLGLLRGLFLNKSVRATAAWSLKMFEVRLVVNKHIFILHYVHQDKETKMVFKQTFTAPTYMHVEVISKLGTFLF